MLFVTLLPYQSFLSIVCSNFVVFLFSISCKLISSCFVKGLGISKSFERCFLLPGVVPENAVLADVLGRELVQAASTFLVVVNGIVFNWRSITLIVFTLYFTSSFFLVVVISKIVELKV